ncbi:ribosomal protein S18-alanine N-acetyltransferase [Pseudomonas putida]|nr:ribosomal protein S18-alanine N-acetyltransferase [Pseudomonas putida]MDD1964749.1 ribosomal protein S18-alanine N-acetyltransferase [Pseudomonas putida]
MLFDFRFASTDDVDDLVALEQACFTLDRLRPRHFRWMLSRANASLIVATVQESLVGYALVLFRRGSPHARLYSIAVSPQCRGHGLGQRLLEQAQDCAVGRRCARLRLEVRADNPAAIRLYESNGYQRFATVDDFYEDHAQALRFEKPMLLGDPSAQKVGGVITQITTASTSPGLP